MPLQFVKEYPNGPALVRDRIQKLPFISKHPKVLATSFDIERLGKPHAVYDLRPEDLASGKLLADSVHPRGQRYLVHSEGEPAASAEVIWIRGKTAQYVHINIGRFVGATGHALRYLEAHEQVKFGSFEARLLRCRPLYLMAIWLKSDTGEQNDLIYPLNGGAPAPFLPEQLYPVADFQGNIQIIVQTRQPAP